MSTFEYVFMGMMLVPLLPALYAITRGWTQSLEPKAQRRAAIAMLASVVGFVLTISVQGVGQLVRGSLLAGSLSVLCVGLLVLAAVISGSHVRAAQHLVRTGERLELTDAEERRRSIQLRVLLVLGVVVFVLVIVSFFSGVWRTV